MLKLYNIFDQTNSGLSKKKQVHFAKSYNGACVSEIYHAFMSLRYTFYSLFKKQ